VLKSVLDSCVEPESLLGYFKDESGGYEVDRRLDPGAAAYRWFIEVPPLALIRRIQPPFLRALAFLSVPVLLFALGALLVSGLKVILGGRTGQST
jgi:hypothetical protein